MVQGIGFRYSRYKFTHLDFNFSFKCALPWFLSRSWHKVTTKFFGNKIILLKALFVCIFCSQCFPKTEDKPYSYHNSAHFSMSSLLFKTWRFRDSILSPSSGSSYSVWPNRISRSLSPDLKTETESSLRNVAFQTKHRMMDNVQNMVWVRERTIPTERPPLVGEVIANFCG
jgi:hypothetical protein